MGNLRYVDMEKKVGFQSFHGGLRKLDLRWYLELWKKFVRGTLGWKKKFALKLPHNWLNEFCGFIIITVSQAFKTLITMNIREEVDEGCQSEHRQESYVAPEHDDHSTIYVAYVSFSSLQHTAWLKSAYNMIWFSLSSENECSIIAELVPRRSKGDPMHRTKLATDCSQFWDEHKDSETFTIQLLESNSSIDILWRPLN
ncbi:hypothetical protein L1987_39550 [Smallanthus sonchifolius]|uniref:Uncharacterized protein n=1 Tax=Smallanthus sonchifolius TaxID=185202 RepID=A0ACB9HMB2_9ASTR|nr:hypothetical protein L1987_39550 [Smallanthus sonchifolius]